MGLIKRLLFSDPTKALIQKDLQLLAKRHNIIAANIANASTPGYKAIEMEFDEKLRKAMGRDGIPMMKTDKKHLTKGGDVSKVMPDIKIDKTTKGRVDGNTVNLDKEIVNLSQNQILWNSVLTMKKAYGKITKMAVEGIVK